MVLQTAPILHNRYRLGRRLGEGGCGEVFEALDTHLDNRVVALKRLHHWARVALQQRFANEALLLARLSHPHVIEIYDRFEEGGVAYQVMPYAAGGSLADLLRRSENAAGLPIRDVITIGESLAGALRAAHALGITHRDVKPSNVLLFKMPEGYVVKLADFGVAAQTDRASGLTQTGELVGTLTYLSPEQVRGHAADGASDVYALGALLYRLLTNRHYLELPEDDMEKRRRIVAVQPVGPATVRADVPAWLNDLVLRMLAKAPADRPTAAQLTEALGQAGGAQPVQPAAAYHANRIEPHRPAVPRSPVVAPQRNAAPRRAVWPRRARWVGWLFGLVVSFALLLVVLQPWWPAQINPGLLLPDQSAWPAWVVDSWQQAVDWLQTAGWPPPAVPDGTAETEDSAQAAQPVYAVVTGTAPARGLRLREAPTLDAAVLTVLPEGAVVEVLAFRDYESWVLINAAPIAGSGWVYGGYLRLLDR